MGRPGYMSLYADERTQQIFDEFVKIKGIKKSTALTEMLEIYMLCQDEELYTELKKKSLGVEVAKQVLVQRADSREINDYIFMKLGTAYDVDGNAMDGYDTIDAYIRNCSENGEGYTWFSTESLHFGMAKKKVEYYNSLCELGEKVKIYTHYHVREDNISLYGFLSNEELKMFELLLRSKWNRSQNSNSNAFKYNSIKICISNNIK